MALHRLDRPVVEAADVRRGPEGTVAHVPAGAPGDLRDLVGVQPAPLVAVELDQAGERDVADVHVQAHADGIGRDQMVDLARLIESDLGVARARTESAEHDRRAAAPAPHQLGERVDLLGRECDHGAAPGQPGDLGRLDVLEGREPRAADQLGLGHQLPDQRPDGVGAEKHGLVAAPGAQQPVGEHVAALGIGAQLDLVDREETDLEVLGHGFDGGDEVARGRRLDPFLAGDQGRPRRRRARPRSGRRSRAPAGAAESRSGRSGAPASGRPRNGSCRCWSAPGPPARAADRWASRPWSNYCARTRPKQGMIAQRSHDVGSPEDRPHHQLR